MTKKDKIQLAILCPSLFLVLVGLLTGIYFLDRNEFDKTVSNPPDTNWVEEDLEPVFMTTGVCVLDENHEENHVYYKVSANDFYYKVHYAVSHTWLGCYRWKYINHIQINYVVD